MTYNVSIIIPTYNRQKLLPKAIESAINQVSANVEVIVVDDGGMDETESVIRQINYPIRYYYQTNSGLSSARNFGLREATSEYIIFLDSDDLIMPNKSKLQIEILETRKDIAAVYSYWKITDLEGNPIAWDGMKYINKLIPTILYRNIAPIHAFIFRTSSIREVGGFDENLNACEDWDLLFRLLVRGYRFDFTPEVTAIYRFHKENMSSNRQLMLKSGVKLIKNFSSDEHLQNKYRENSNILECIQYLEVICRCFENNEYEDAEKYLAQMLLSFPFTKSRFFLNDMDLMQKEIDINSTVKKITHEDVKSLRDNLIGYINEL